MEFVVPANKNKCSNLLFITLPQAWTLAAAEDLVGMQLFYSIFSRYSENLIIDLAS